VTGHALVRLQQAAAGADITTHARRLAHDRRWWRRLRGVRLLTELEHDAHIPRTLLDDRHPAVRAAAATGVARDGSRDTAAQLLEMLDDPDPLCRFTAKTALIRTGSTAAEPLRAYLGVEPVPPRPAEALEIAAVLSDPSFVAPALRLSAARNPRTRRAATALLARAAGEAATGRIMELLEDPDERVRAQAARGLGDLRHWQAAPALCRATGDPAWEVRSAAALALRRIGAPGRIYLREALRSDDPFAADISRQVLSLPESAMTLVVP
jgi:HEAT repeat protein